MNSITKTENADGKEMVRELLKAVRPTKDYSIFKKLYAHRELDPKNLKRLKKIIQEDNQLMYCPIWVNKNFEVLNGQHRLAIAKELNLTIYYLVCEGITLEHVMWMHTNRISGDVIFKILFESLFSENIKLADVN